MLESQHNMNEANQDPLVDITPFFSILRWFLSFYLEGKNVSHFRIEYDVEAYVLGG